MCGIFGYVGSKKDAPQQTVEGLKKLEYRGYDSWGVAYLANPSLTVKKNVGKIGEAWIDDVVATMAIGHTRWATHGGITVGNAHPHLSPDGSIAVVHNGVVENFVELKETFPKYPFQSQTDTEVITALMAEALTTLEAHKAAHEVSKKLKGLNAFVVCLAGTKQILAYKNGSPLIIGKSLHGLYLASDTVALAGLVDSVLYLEDGQVAVLSANSLEVFENDQLVSSLNWQLLTLSAQSVDKQSFPHFMIKEIMEQPGVLQEISQKKMSLPSAKKYMLVGCGSAYHACLAATYFFALTGKKQAQAFAGSEFAPWRELIDTDTHVIFVSQSGETIDIVEHAQWLKNHGHTFSAVVNRTDSTLARLATTVIDISAGPEQCVLATKSFTAKLAVFLLLTAEKPTTISSAGDSISEILTQKYHETYISPASKVLLDNKNIFILGKNEMYPMALEAALKIKESTYIHAEAFASGELKHGVLALVEKGTPVFALLPDSAAAADVLTGSQEVKARGGYLIGVGDKILKSDVFDQFIPVEAEGLGSAIASTVIFQLIAYYTTVALGRDPDKPRNLAKSVTVK